MIKRIIERIRVIFANSSWESKRKYLVSKGAVIGEGTRLNCNVNAFGTEPYLIEVGNNCLFAAGIHIITHDGGIKVLNSLGYFEQKMDRIASVRIGNNVFIGTGAYIMPGVTIGDNVIIGTGAIVVKDICNNSVAVGIPAKVIEKIEEYYENGNTKKMYFPTGGMSSTEKRKYFANHKNTV